MVKKLQSLSGEWDARIPLMEGRSRIDGRWRLVGGALGDFRDDWGCPVSVLLNRGQGNGVAVVHIVLEARSCGPAVRINSETAVLASWNVGGSEVFYIPLRS